MDFAEAGGQPRAEFCRLVIERAHAPAVDNVTALVDDVEALGPGGVSAVGRVAHVIDAEGNRVLKALDEIVGDFEALLKIFWLGVADVVLHVGLHLPFVGGMGFAHVDGEEVGVILVVVIKLRDVADLATERRSSKAAEDQHERLRVEALANVEMVGAVEGDEFGVGRVVTDF
jgi:hypothetical protein